MAIGKEIFQKHQPGKREPLRTLREFAEEFGVTPWRLSGLINANGGPAPMTVSKSAAVNNSYYKPSEMRKWWASIKADVK